MVPVFFPLQASTSNPTTTRSKLNAHSNQLRPTTSAEIYGTYPHTHTLRKTSKTRQTSVPSKIWSNAKYLNQN